MTDITTLSDVTTITIVLIIIISLMTRYTVNNRVVMSLANFTSVTSVTPFMMIIWWISVETVAILITVCDSLWWFDKCDNCDERGNCDSGYDNNILRDCILLWLALDSLNKCDICDICELCDICDFCNRCDFNDKFYICNK